MPVTVVSPPWVVSIVPTLPAPSAITSMPYAPSAPLIVSTPLFRIVACAVNPIEAAMVPMPLLKRPSTASVERVSILIAELPEPDVIM